MGAITPEQTRLSIVKTCLNCGRIFQSYASTREYTNHLKKCKIQYLQEIEEQKEYESDIDSFNSSRYSIKTLSDKSEFLRKSLPFQDKYETLMDNINEIHKALQSEEFLMYLPDNIPLNHRLGYIEAMEPCNNIKFITVDDIIYSALNQSFDAKTTPKPSQKYIDNSNNAFINQTMKLLIDNYSSLFIRDPTNGGRIGLVLRNRGAKFTEEEITVGKILGILMAKTLIDHNKCNEFFNLAFLQSIVDDDINTKLIKEYSPEIYSSIKDMEKKFNDTTPKGKGIVDDLFFCINQKDGEQIDLIVDGRNTEVLHKKDLDNYEMRYINLLQYNYGTYSSYIKNGFFDYIDRNLIIDLKAKEFEFILNRQNYIDLKEWKDRTTYRKSIDSAHQSILLFWSFLKKKNQSYLNQLIKTIFIKRDKNRMIIDLNDNDYYSKFAKTSIILSKKPWQKTKKDPKEQQKKQLGKQPGKQQNKKHSKNHKQYSKEDNSGQYDSTTTVGTLPKPEINIIESKALNEKPKINAHFASLKNTNDPQLIIIVPDYQTEDEINEELDNNFIKEVLMV